MQPLASGSENPVVSCGISHPFEWLSPAWGEVTHALPPRAPLYSGGLPPPFSLDLHVLGTPPAFVLSQDQTLHFILIKREKRRSARTSHSLFSFQRSGRNRPIPFNAAGLNNIRKHSSPVKH